MLEAGGADTDTQRAIPGSEPSQGPFSSPPGDAQATGPGKAASRWDRHWMGAPRLGKTLVAALR